MLNTHIDTNNDGQISEKEINNAILVLEKARREKEMKEQKHSFLLFHNYLVDSNTSTN
jgi:hypothetical protein